jgi:hypothetical protein
VKYCLATIPLYSGFATRPRLALSQATVTPPRKCAPCDSPGKKEPGDFAVSEAGLIGMLRYEKRIRIRSFRQ